MNSYRNVILAAAAATVYGLSGAADAGYIASTNSRTSGNTNFSIMTLAGWQFTVTEKITVNALGIWDDFGNGLSLPHTIGIFDSSSALVTGSIAAGSGSVLISGTRWIMVSPIDLQPGITYDVIATSMCGFPFLEDTCGVVNKLVSTIVYDPRVVQTALTFSGGNDNTLHPPPYGHGFSSDGYLGPNFAFFDPVAIPEPTSLALLALGFVGLRQQWLHSFRQKKCLR